MPKIILIIFFIKKDVLKLYPIITLKYFKK